MSAFAWVVVNASISVAESTLSDVVDIESNAIATARRLATEAGLANLKTISESSSN